MLFRHEGEPFSLDDLLMYGKAKPTADLLDVLTLFVKDPGKDRDAGRMKNAVDLRKQVDDDVSREVSQQKMNAVADHAIDRAAERPDFGFVVELNVGSGY